MQTLSHDTDRKPTIFTGLVPSDGETEVLIKVRACVLSRSESIDSENLASGDKTKSAVLSRSFTGVIESIGKRVDSLAPGDRVIVCHANGEFPEYYSVPACHVIRLPMGISFEEGAIAPRMPTVLNGIEKAQVKSRTVFISGAGSTGLLSTQIARISGATNIIVADLYVKRLQRARDVGADTVINVSTEDSYRILMDQTSGEGVDVCIDCAGNDKSFLQCEANLRSGGTLVVLKTMQDPIAINMQEWSARSLQLVMGQEQQPQTPFLLDQGLKLVGIRAVRLRPLLSHVFPVHRLNEALDLVTDHPDLAVEVAVVRT